MKKIYLTMSKASFILGISLFSHSTYPVSVYLENNYGEKLNYRTSSTDLAGQNIGTNVRISLGDLNSIPELWIRTTSMVSGYLSSSSYLPSSYYDLKRLLDQIKSQQQQHRNDDAIVSIDRIGTKQWNPNVRWETKSGMSFEPPTLTGAPRVTPVIPVPKPFTQPATEIEIDLVQLEKEEALMATTTADGRLNQIKNGALGPDYARKAAEICSANYTQAEKLGKVNLYSELKRNLIAPIYRIDKRVRTKKGFINPDLAPAINDIKTNINTLYGALARYKTRGEAS